MDTETIDHLFLELSQFAKATTKRELELRAINAELLAALKELADLIDAIREYEYTPDMFTTQPARTAIAHAEGRE